MSKKLSGRIELYSMLGEFVTSAAYNSPYTRNNIIEGWKRQYPRQSFYVIIIPKIIEEISD